MAIKTNAMRILDKEKIDYAVYTYDVKDGLIDGVSVAAKIGKDPGNVYKTLIAKGASGEHFCFIIPVARELNLKAAARCAAEKSVAMVKVADITGITGYVRGGCSPIGLKNPLRTFIDASAQQLETIIVSGGKIGVQIALNPRDLIALVHATTGALTEN